MTRRARVEFRPSLTDTLETRVVLNASGFRGPSVLVSGLTPRLQTLGRTPAQPIVALTNKAFDLFVTDYTQARAAYISTLSPTSTDTSTLNAFKQYTVSRVNLLAQQIINNVMTSTAALAKNGSSYVLPSLVSRKINGLELSSNNSPIASDRYRIGTLGYALINAIPPVGSSQAAASLNALAQDQSIEAARVSVINGLNVIKNGDFGVKNKKH